MSTSQQLRDAAKRLRGFILVEGGIPIDSAGAVRSDEIYGLLLQAAAEIEQHNSDQPEGWPKRRWMQPDGFRLHDLPQMSENSTEAEVLIYRVVRA